jgi:disulfide bond formation protein DsbB
MLYETVWLFFALGVGILISIGLLGLIFSPAIPPRILKVMAMIISMLIILTGIYFSYQWSAQKKGIQVLSQQAEETIKQYLATHQKNDISPHPP